MNGACDARNWSNTVMPCDAFPGPSGVEKNPSAKSIEDEERGEIDWFSAWRNTELNVAVIDKDHH